MKALMPSSHQPLVRLFTFGSFRMERLVAAEDGQSCYEALTSEEMISRGKPLQLLKILACQWKRRAKREQLIDKLWSEQEQKTLKDTRTTLQTMSSSLRELLRLSTGESLLTTLLSSEELMLADQHRLWIDADEFTALLGQAIRAASEQKALALWEQAHVLYQGAFLPEDQYNDWSKAKRETLRGKAGQCLYALADIYTAQQRLDLAQDLLWNAATAQPRDEDALCRLLSLLERQERYHAAWQLYQDAKNEAAQEEYKLTPRLHAIAKRIREKLTAIEPYSITVTNTLISLPFAPSIPLVIPNVVSSENKVLFPQLLSQQLVPEEEIITTDCMTWFSEKLACLVAFVAQVHSKVSSIDVQFMLDRELRVFDKTKQMFDPDEYFISRRNALLVIAALPKGLLSVVRQQQQVSFIQTEFLPSCAASITACWHLLNGRELTSVERTLSSYFSYLVDWSHQSSSYSQIAAHLAAQGYMLLSLVASHRLQQHKRIVYCKEAVKYAKEAKDAILFAKTLTMLGNALYEQKSYKEMLRAYEEAKRVLDEQKRHIPSVLQSKILMGLAHAYAQKGLIVEALNAITEARGVLTEDDEPVPVFLSTDDGLFSLILFEGWVRLDLDKRYPNNNHGKHAAQAFAQIEELPEAIIVPERIQIEIINRRAEAAISLGDMEAFKTYTLEGAKGAKKLGSEKRLQEVVLNCNEAGKKWSHESQVLELVDILR